MPPTTTPPRLSPLSGSASRAIDLLRSLGAIEIFAGHLLALSMAPVRALSGHRLGATALSLLVGRTHAVATIYFVLSGYLVARSAFQSIAEGRYSAGAFLRARLTRIWVVLLPALALGGLLDHLGLLLVGDGGFYSAAEGFFNDMPVREKLSAATFAGNLFFLPTIVCGTFGTNRVLWSLSHQVVYYVLFALALELRAGPPSPLRRAACGSAMVALLALVAARNIEILHFSLLFGAGAALSLVKLPRPLGSVWARSGAAGIFLAAFVWSRNHPDVGGTLAQGGALVLLLAAVVAQEDGAERPLRSGTIGRWISNASLTLYLTHLPVFTLLVALTHGAVKFAWDARGVAVTAVIGTVSLLYALIVFWLFERRYVKSRRRPPA